MNIFWFLFFIAFLALFYCAYKAKPADNKSGSIINPPKQWLEAQNTFTVGTYNVQSGKDIHGNRDIKRSAAIIADSDIVGIQEVYAQTWLGQPSHAQTLAETSDFGWLFAATRHRWFREHRGNAFLSKFPVSSWQISMLPDQSGKSFRNLVTSTLSIQGTDITVIVTHLHTRQGRQEQLELALAEFKKHSRAILLGDFNTKPDDPLLKDLFADKNNLDAIQLALPDYAHNNRIDWIITKGFEVIDGNYEPTGISDHPFFQVTLTLSGK
ncbi:MAG: endonuclease/exonuclease/phosphatase family protein [Arenicella sp.]